MISKKFQRDSFAICYGLVMSKLGKDEEMYSLCNDALNKIIAKEIVRFVKETVNKSK